MLYLKNMQFLFVRQPDMIFLLFVRHFLFVAHDQGTRYSTLLIERMFISPHWGLNFVKTAVTTLPGGERE